MADGPAGAALVTGAARRIGRAIVERLAADGWPTVVHTSARSAAEAQGLADALVARGLRAAVVVADLAEAGAAGALIEKASATFGPLACLVNHASVFEPDEPASFEALGFDRHIAVNLRAPLLLAQHFAAQAPPGAGVVNILDQRVLRPGPDYFTYAISKSALWSATRTLAQAFAPRVRVNAVGPGPVLPNAHEGEAGFAAEVAGLPLARAPDAREIADAVAWLMRARSVTGQMIAVDGGQHLA